MKAIITGVAGFIGSHAADRFLAEGHDVVGLDNLSRPGSSLNLEWLRKRHPQFQFDWCDVRWYDGLKRIFDQHGDAECVIHEAGQVAVTRSVIDPAEDFQINALGTFNLLECTRLYCPNAAFLFASTNKVYGELAGVPVSERARRYEFVGRPRGINEDQPLDFHSPYGCSKGSADQYVRDYARIYGMHTVVFRQSCIYGTRQFGVEDQGWVAWFVIAAVLGFPVTVYGTGKQVRDILWIEDLINAYELAIKHIGTATGKVYNLGGGAANTLSILELIDILRSSIDASLECARAPWRLGDQKIYISDCSRAHADLGWRPVVSPRDGIKLLVEWASQNRDVFFETIRLMSRTVCEAVLQ
jgi:CDP-paratose 2-epimerase